MNELLTEVVEAHGGTGRWQELTQARATLVSGGDLFAIKGLPQDVTPRTMTVRLHEEYASVQPFGAHDQKTGFTAGRVSIEKLDGHVVAERVDPRASFAGHTLETPWDPLDRAYFNGYALWTYLTTPFLLAMPGFTVTDIEPWREGDEVWPGLRATFPPRIASHSTHQDFYFGPDRLLRRHDYHVDVAGGFAAAQYVYDLAEADGIVLPTRRRAYRRDTDGRPLLEQVMVSIDLSDVHFS
ncbi:hypothetical protein ACGFWD_37650 [Streptomyces sp. NPDC048448]|uniref:hypothetical protein n=1 Tax=unclassified Streptomyces TaxID=2593676 RepID=UPI00143E4AC3|nr:MULTISPECIES: hypothetical protein [unclassified Streptomyces]QIY66882.1 hypothetical protein HEP85_42295 [Streptomyces sp. RPA4-2]